MAPLNDLSDNQVISTGNPDYHLVKGSMDNFLASAIAGPRSDELRSVELQTRSEFLLRREYHQRQLQRLKKRLYSQYDESHFNKQPNSDYLWQSSLTHEEERQLNEPPAALRDEWDMLNDDEKNTLWEDKIDQYSKRFRKLTRSYATAHKRYRKIEELETRLKENPLSLNTDESARLGRKLEVKRLINELRYERERVGRHLAGLRSRQLAPIHPEQRILRKRPDAALNDPHRAPPSKLLELLSFCSIAPRAACQELIAMGVVAVNEEIVMTPSSTVDVHQDIVTVFETVVEIPVGRTDAEKRRERMVRKELERIENMREDRLFGELV
eukprot:GHVN01104179.1.p1 GENE.GHVN01104179.1~~GHVN01104179.1.p1  ORF type:complete len:347 (+),score=40.15 GHVN01104179.1:61-1041(+)